MTDMRPRRRSTCRLCDSDSLDLVLRLAPTPPADAFVTSDQLGIAQPEVPLDLYTCGKCGHAQLLDVVPPELLFGDYIYQSASSLEMVSHFRGYAQCMVDTFSLKGGSFVIDVGSNDGTLLSFFADQGIRVLGIDPAERIARQATEAGIETTVAFLTPEVADHIREDYGTADLVTANNVFAHSDDLGSIVDSIGLMLSPGGVFVFEVSYLLDMIEGMVFDFIYHEHLCHHSVKPLVPFLRRHGLDLFDVQRIPTKGGSLRCFAQLADGPRPVSQSVQMLVEREELAGLYAPTIYQEWEERISRNRDEVSTFLQEARDSGRMLGGYGASATSTVLTYHYRIGEVLRVLVDDIPERQGRFSPGYHLPVVGPQWIYDHRPDDVVVLAWRFADAIVAKHREYLDGGGHFIVPLPNLTVI